MSETEVRNRPPLHSFSVQGLSVSLWENQNDQEDGTVRTSRSVQVRKSFFSRRDNAFAEQKISLNPTELSCLAELLRRMEEHIVEHRCSDAPF